MLFKHLIAFPKETKNVVKALYSIPATLDNFQHGPDLLVQNMIILNRVHSFSFRLVSDKLAVTSPFPIFFSFIG